ncbi:ABC transporter permease [Streptomyces sp. 8K308]|uniref:ABC transporter permease n=1 Tax=Streptomyces sp. 8K308 TaxID=2530388 RepID=UPI00104603EC|nr:ABC transporter permease [Streptomyces sp. 8K308]TDC20256.1 ABC transporter permease [Streptomyces sp. 8K308]
MSTLALTVTDSATMLRRNLRRALRYPAMTFSVLLMPIMMLLLFNYAFGSALGTGINTMGGVGDGEYIDYVAPGIILVTATSGAVATAVSVCVDMTEGIVNRFRTMSVSRAAILAGHVVGSVLQTMIALVLIVGVALAIGFRPNANALEWLAAFGLLGLVTLALTWLAAAMGLVARTPESASNTPLPLTFLPFLGSAIVPADSMPTAMRWFTEYQPFTPMIETLRGLLMGSEIGSNGLVALAWCVGLTLLGYLWARAAFARATRR